MRLSSWSVMGDGGGAIGTRLDSGAAGGWPLRTGPGWARSYGGPRGLSVWVAKVPLRWVGRGGGTLLWSFVFLEVPQIQFNFRVLDVRRGLTGAGYGGRRSCDSQWQAPAVHFRRGCKLCRKPSSFRRRGSWVLFLAQRLVRQWTHLRQFLGALRIFHVKGGYSDPEVDFVLLSGVEV